MRLNRNHQGLDGIRREGGHLRKLIATASALACLLAFPAFAQTANPSKSTAQMSRSERAAAEAARRQKLIEKNAALRRKRDACLQERKAKNIPVFQRPAFIRDCMARP